MVKRLKEQLSMNGRTETNEKREWMVVLATCSEIVVVESYSLEM